MDAVLKKEIEEIVELVKTMPESFQVRALEMLMQDLLTARLGRHPSREGRKGWGMTRRIRRTPNDRGVNQEISTPARCPCESRRS